MAERTLTRELAYQVGGAVIWARRIETVKEDPMAVKYWYNFILQYKGVCVWKKQVSKGNAYLIADIVKVLHNVDPEWGFYVESLN